MRHLAFALGTLFMLAGPCLAQEALPLQILLDEPDENGAKCGITQQTLEAPAVEVLKAGGGDFEKEFSSPYLYLKADFGYREDPKQCSWRIAISVRALPTTDQRDRFPDSGFERLLLCEAELSGQATANAAQTVSADIRDYLKTCLAAVKF